MCIRDRVLMPALRHQTAHHPCIKLIRDYKNSFQRFGYATNPDRVSVNSTDLCIQWVPLLHWSMACPVLKPAPNRQNWILCHFRGVCVFSCLLYTSDAADE